MEADFGTQGSQIAKTFTVENATHGKIAVELTLYKRQMAIDGKETRTPTDRFTVYPEQLQLEPGEKRNVRVTWTGPAEVPVEESYRLVADQLPVQLKAPKASKGTEVSLKFVLQYVASLYVSSAPVKPKVRVESTRVLSGGQGQANLEVTLINEGTAHQLLAGSRIFLIPRGIVKSGPIELSRDQVKTLDAENILAGGRRRFVFALPKELVGKPFDAEIEIRSK